MDRATLVRTLTDLTPADFATLIAMIPGAARQLSRVSVPEQGGELIRWAESSKGPGLEAIQRALGQLNDGKPKEYFPPGESTRRPSPGVPPTSREPGLAVAAIEGIASLGTLGIVLIFSAITTFVLSILYIVFNINNSEYGLLSLRPVNEISNGLLWFYFILPIGMSSFAGGFVAARLLRSAKVSLIVICALVSISIEYLLIFIMFKIEGSSMGQNESLDSYILTYLIVLLIYVTAAFFAARLGRRSR